MAILKINGDTSGSVSLTVPAVAGTNTATIPASTGNVLLDSTVGVCRAWVNFNGTGTVAIRASFNVSSITDNGVGTYTMNFSTALTDANYSAVITADSGSSFGNIAKIESATNQVAGSCRVQTSSTSALQDAAVVNAAFFR